jgi:hypothetical protein
MKLNNKTIIPTMTIDGPSRESIDRTDAGTLTAVDYSGFASHGFFRGYVRFYEDPEMTQVFSSAASDANDQWERQREKRAMDHVVKRMLVAESTLRDAIGTDIRLTNKG